MQPVLSNLTLKDRVLDIDWQGNPVQILMIATRSLHKRFSDLDEASTFMELSIVLMKPVDIDICTNWCISKDQVSQSINLNYVLTTWSHTPQNVYQ